MMYLKIMETIFRLTSLNKIWVFLNILAVYQNHWSGNIFKYNLNLILIVFIGILLCMNINYSDIYYFIYFNFV